MRREDDLPAGVPEYADDESTAWEDVRESDPAPLPPDREDGPLALDEYGTTEEEQRLGEPLDDRLAREEPEQSTEPVPDPVTRHGASAEEAAMHETG
jgi:hypothetical protein